MTTGRVANGESSLLGGRLADMLRQLLEPSRRKLPTLASEDVSRKQTPGVARHTECKRKVYTMERFAGKPRAASACHERAPSVSSSRAKLACRRRVIVSVTATLPATSANRAAAATAAAREENRPNTADPLPDMAA